MPARYLVEAWVALLVLSAATAALTTMHPEGAGRAIVAGGVLLLAGLKARVILGRYLGLAGSHFWMNAFGLAIGGFLLLSFALYTFASKG